MEVHAGQVSTSSRRLIVKVSGAQISGRQGVAAAEARTDTPILVAIHGGGYTSAYFDVDGHSLLQRAAAVGFRAIALDRPGYGESTPLPSGEETIARNAERLDAGIGQLWSEIGQGAAGIVLVGHSIGGAITIAIAARRLSWPLLGIAVSGVGLMLPPQVGGLYATTSDTLISVPPEAKDSMLFGPSWTHGEDMPAASHVADSPVPRRELQDIFETWPHNVRELAAKVVVPVHYRQGERDALWVVDAGQIADFGAAFSGSPEVDAALIRSTGHCIDFHRLGLSFHLEQLSFASRCAVSPRPSVGLL
jgi:pimeloyl-ACP methyl ester carboxylesterase